MSARSQSFTTNGTFTAPATLLGGTVSVDVRGAMGGPYLGSGTNLYHGGLGGRVRANIALAAGATLKVYGSYFSGGGGSHTLPQGGASAAVCSSSGTLLIEAGGGGGGRTYYAATPPAGRAGPGGGGGYAGGSGATFPGGGGASGDGIPGGGGGARGGYGGYAATGTHRGPGAGVSGSINGGNANSTAGGAGAGSSGVAGGGTGFNGATGGTSYAAGSGVSGATFTAAWNLGGTTVVISYSVADSDLVPSLSSPANGAYEDMAVAGSITFKRNPGTQSGTMTGWAVRRKDGGSYTYWKASTGTWVATAVYNAISYLTAFGTDTYQYTFPATKWTDGNTYNWSVSTQNSLTGHVLTSPFATDFTVIATAMPTVTVTTPAFTTNDGTPKIAWTVVLGTGDSQTRYRAIVYTKAQTMGGGFSPGTTAGVWDSGTVASAAGSVTCATVLTNTATYVVYVQVAETGTVRSSWTASSAHKAFKVSFTPPATPSITVTPSTDMWGHPVVVIHVTGTGTNLVTAQIERSLDGTTWTTVRTATAAPLATNSAMVTDQEAPLGAAVHYRARVTADDTGQTVASDWTTPVTTMLPNDQWWILDPLTPASAIALYRAPTSSSSMSGGPTGSITIGKTTVQGAFRTFGNPDYVVVQGTAMNEEFTLTLDFFTETLYERFNALRDQQIPVLIQSDMPGEFYYCVLGPARPMTIARATTRRTSPIRQVVVHCYPVPVP